MGNHMAETSTDEEYRARFNTELTPDEEKKYQAFVADESAKRKRDVGMDEIDYDLRGDWKRGAERDDRGHGGDEFKKPNHPTFSEHSVYHGSENEDGTKNTGGKWHYENPDQPDMPTAFEQSDTNKQHWPTYAIEDYLKRNEEGVRLIKSKGK